MIVSLHFNLPDALDKELARAAEESRITTHSWAAQVIEAELAARRLPHVEMGAHGAQLVTER